MNATPGTSITFGLVSVVGLVLGNAFFVAAEFALVGLRRSRIEELAQRGVSSAILARRAVSSLDRYISATQLGITLASLGLGWVGEPALASLIGGWFTGLPAGFQSWATHTVAAAFAFALITVLHIVLGELVPKALAITFPERVSAFTIRPLTAFLWAMTGPITILNGAAGGILRLLGVRRRTSQASLHSPTELRILVEQSQQAGSLGSEDARLLEGVFEFSEKNAEQVMTPRTQMTAIEAGSSVEEAAGVVAAAGRSRYPVYEGSLDDIVGVVHAKAILAALRAGPHQPVRQVMRPPLFVPGSREVEDVLTDMKRVKSHMAVVLDEYGGTAGLVTMEDLLEEIVGPIEDEYDRPDRVPAPADGSLVLDGALPIAEANERLDLRLDDAEYTTLGGYLFGQLGRLPAVGDRVRAGGREFEIAEMEGRRVRRVRVMTKAAGEKKSEE
ncbi:MAG TPA: hemolysin family protein [Gemmatimonadales bacterium]|nr:hemolysin family protein [Gemmatimonadales bacterium]